MRYGDRLEFTKGWTVGHCRSACSTFTVLPVARDGMQVWMIVSLTRVSMVGLGQ